MADPPHDFEVVFPPDMSPEKIAEIMAALADHYRSCGGAGFKVKFTTEEAE